MYIVFGTSKITLAVAPGGPPSASQWRNDGVAAASSDGGPTRRRGSATVLEFLVINFRGPDLRK